MVIKNFYFSTLNLFFPTHCFGCNQYGEWLCKDCFHKLKKREFQVCLGCGRPDERGAVCHKCKDILYLDGLLAAGYERDALLMKLVKAYKYQFAREIARIGADFLEQFYQKLILEKNWPNFDIIIPIPLHPRRKRWRGFNQAELLAREFAKKHAFKICADDLARVKHHKAQALLKAEERQANILNSFVWQGESLAGKAILLIDDLATTGATLNEAARILKNSGAKKVWGLVLGAR